MKKDDSITQPTPTIADNEPIDNDEINDWSKPVDGVINVPDELDSLVNSMGFQYRLHRFSKRFGEAECICRMAYIAQKFFKKMYGAASHPIVDKEDKCRILLRELFMKSNLGFPETEQDLDWFNQGKEPIESYRDLLIRISEELGLGKVDIVTENGNDVKNELKEWLKKLPHLHQ